MKKCRVVKSLSVLFFVTLGACGGGSSADNFKEAPPPVKTKTISVTVIDGYIHGADVCVDKNNNARCDSNETPAKTGPDGRVTLDISVDDVGKYPIVAFVPADAIDKDDDKLVGTAYTLIAPADQSTLVSPLSTLVQHLIVVGRKTSAVAAAQIKETIGDPGIDYIANSESTQTRVAAKILVRLMQYLPASMPVVSGQTDAQKTDAVNDILVKALPDVRVKAIAIADSPVCRQSITSAECQKSVLEEANAMISGGKLVEIAAPSVPGVNRLTDTGITSALCLAYDNPDFVECSAPEAISLNSKQDGMLGLDVSSPGSNDGTLGFSYSLVSRMGGGNYDKTECVKDNITGLIWEGKPFTTNKTSKRDASNTYNYLDGHVENVDTYVEVVNADKLCGYGDWRLPTFTELLSLMNFSNVQDFGSLNENGAIDTNWFPNTMSSAKVSDRSYGQYLSSDFHIGDDGKRVYSVDFASGLCTWNLADQKKFVRLVR
jgi:hypothetical protein